MSSASIAAGAPLVLDSPVTRRRWPSLSVGGRIYALCPGLILITVGVATLGYCGLAGQGKSLGQYIRVSEATKEAVTATMIQLSQLADEQRQKLSTFKTA
jgi:hypothetical protein